MLNQRYDTPEKLSGTDAEVIQWRKLVVTRHYGGRDAPFDYRNPDGLAPDAVLRVALVSGRPQVVVERDEVERRADPRDRRDDMEPAEEQIAPAPPVVAER